jgi:hypothetical protein
VILAGQPRALHGIDDTTEDNGTCPLNVIVEAGVDVLVPFQCRERILEVLKLDHNSARRKGIPLASDNLGRYWVNKVHR